MKNVCSWLATSSPRVLVPTTQVTQNILHISRLSTLSSTKTVFGCSRRSLCSNVATWTSSGRTFGFPEMNARRGISVTSTRFSNIGNRMGVSGTTRNFATQANTDEYGNQSDLAHSYSAAGDHNKAVQVRRQILDMKKRTLGDDHPLVFLEKFLLARSLCDQGGDATAGDLQEALELRKEFAQGVKKDLGAEHPYYLQGLRELASSYAILKQSQEEIKVRQEVVDIQTKLQGEEHSDTLDALEDLAYAYSGVAGVDQDPQYYQKALELRRKVVDIKMRVLGAEHQDTIQSKDWLIDVMFNSEAYKESMEMGKENLEMKKKVFGEDHPSTLSSMALLARSMAKVPQADAGSNLNIELKAQVLELDKKVLAIMKKTSGMHQNQLITILSYLSSASAKIGEHHGAVLVTKRLLEAYNSSVGDEDPLTLQTMNNLGYLLDRVGDLKGAFQMQKEVVELTSRVLGEDDPHTITAITNLAVITHKAVTAHESIGGMDGDQSIKEARRLYSRAYEAYKRLYGHSNEGDHAEMTELKRYIDQFNKIHLIS